MKSVNCFFVSALFILGLTFSQSALAAETSNSCATRKPMSYRERVKLQDFRDRLAELNRYRGDEKRYKEKLQHIIKISSPELNSTILIEKGLEALIEENFREQIRETLGLASKEFQIFDMYRQGIRAGDQHPEKMLKARDSLREAILTAKGNETKRVLALSTLHLIANSLVNESRENDNRIKDNAAPILVAAEGVMGVAGFATALLASGPAVEYGTLLAGPKGTVLSACAIGAAGGASVAAMEDAYHSVSTAWIKSKNEGTPFSCELREHMGANFGHSLEDLSKGLGVGLLAGCGVVTASMKYKVPVGWLVTGVVHYSTGDALYSAGKSAWEGYAALQSYNTVLAQLSMTNSDPNCDPGREKVSLASLMGVMGEHPSDSRTSVSALHRFEALQDLALSAKAADQERFAEADEHLRKFRDHMGEIGEHLLNASITGVLIPGIHSDLIPAIRNREDHVTVPKELSKSADELPTAFKSFFQSIFGNSSATVSGVSNATVPTSAPAKTAAAKAAAAKAATAKAAAAKAIAAKAAGVALTNNVTLD